LKQPEESNLDSACFTSFEGKFNARLAAVVPRFFAAG